MSLSTATKDTNPKGTSPTLGGSHDVPFGKHRVSSSEKTDLVRGLFSQVSSYYDRMNDLMSFGLHRIWKDEMLWWVPAGGALLDLGGGTGDIAARYLKREQYRKRSSVSNLSGPTATVADLTAEMLGIGRKRHPALAITWVVAAAEALPFPSDQFGTITCGFAFRNITDRSQALCEALRVLKPGGCLVTLEFSHSNLPVISKLYTGYRDVGLARIGKFFAQDDASYRYLGESIAGFPHAEDWASEIRQAGFQAVQFRRMAGGIVALHRGYKAATSVPPLPAGKAVQTNGSGIPHA